MESERKALYNSLRLNWIRDPSLKVQHWQVEDLREANIDEIIDRIQVNGLPFDKFSFHQSAENYDSPEEMTEALLDDLDISQEAYDKIYLSLFELWRRLLPEKQSLSVFCDELDYQIHLYDTGEIKNFEAFQDTINDLREILEENVDSGLSPSAAFLTLSRETANNIEEFLYDYIADEIDEGHYSYASDLIEGFYPYMSDKRWFDLLSTRLEVQDQGEEIESALQKLLKKVKNADLEFYFELLAFLSKRGDRKTYSLIAKKAIGQFETEEDLADFLALTADFFHFMDDEANESKVLELSKSRSKNSDSALSPKDAVLNEIKKIL